LRVRLKNTGEPANANGILPVHKFPYLDATNICVASRYDITEEPAWAKEMFLQEQNMRAQRRQVAQSRTTSAPDTPAESELAASPSPVARASGEPVTRAKQPVDLADAVDITTIDSSMLMSIPMNSASRRT